MSDIGNKICHIIHLVARMEAAILNAEKALETKREAGIARKNRQVYLQQVAMKFAFNFCW